MAEPTEDPVPTTSTSTTARPNRPSPPTLVELPVDVLKEIVKEVNHTNDLTNLSLTCRCLHALSIPHIYSRFDIVWPDASSPGDRVGVDALTYGLSTLVAAGRRGNNYARWVKKFSLGNGPGDWVGEYNINKEGGKMLGTLVNLAVSRMIALETFSWDMPTGVLRDVFQALHDLNGTLKNVHVRFHDNTETSPPASQDPSRRVETPTFKGFKDLRSLSVLDIDERKYLEEMSYAVEESVDKLRELRIGLAAHVAPNGRWIRDLDQAANNVGSIPATAPPALTAVGGVLGIVVSRIVDLEEGRCRGKVNKPAEVMPGSSVVNLVVGGPAGTTPTDATPLSGDTATLPLGNDAATTSPSGAVADAPSLGSDAPAGASSPSDSASTEPIGSTTAVEEHSAAPSTGSLTYTNSDGFVEVSPNNTTSSVTTGGSGTDVDLLAFFNIVGPIAVQETIPSVSPSPPSSPVESSPSPLTTVEGYPPSSAIESSPPLPASPGEPLASIFATEAPVPVSAGSTIALQTPVTPGHNAVVAPSTQKSKTSKLAHLASVAADDTPVRQLKLETLELERMPLSVRVLLKAVDWTVLTNLTLLGCHDGDRLWKALRQRFAPCNSNNALLTLTNLNVNKPTGYFPRRPTPGFSAGGGTILGSGQMGGYRLRLKKIHTDTVTSALIHFIRDTLPINSLETVFLQECPSSSSPGSTVTMDSIFKSVIKRHRGSLKKLLIDSNVSATTPHTPTHHHHHHHHHPHPSPPPPSPASSKWIFNRDVLTFITSGKMPALRELGLSLDWKNWQYFLTRLPQARQIRSLYIHHVRDGPMIGGFEAREMAAQVLGTVSLRPEVEMCYVGVLGKCFELLESDDDEVDAEGPQSTTGPVAATATGYEEDSDAEDEEDADDADADDNGEDSETEEDAGNEGYFTEDEDDAAEGSGERGAAQGGKGADGSRIRLREILFYDDKVAVFRARHGRL